MRYKGAIDTQRRDAPAIPLTEVLAHAQLGEILQVPTTPARLALGPRWPKTPVEARL